ncbi:MAG: MmcQ/YjbR family DNA-binding protein [Xanthobacteraceae bacterium]
MASVKDFRRIALSLPGTTEAPHFERTAFKVHRIYATLAPDGRSANLMLSPDEQALKCEVAPEAFSRLPNAWGARGATAAKLSALSVAALRNALETAWRHAVAKRR